MAQSYTTATGQVLYIPDVAVNVNVQSSSSGLASSGVVALVGEADQGPSWSQDLSLNQLKLSANAYGPGDLQAVVNKYGSGRLVDAFKAIQTPSSDPRIPNGPNQVILVKTNNSNGASLLSSDGAVKFTAKKLGEPGNSVQASISLAQAEIGPQTGQFSYVPASMGTATLEYRSNGGALNSSSISAGTSPSALVTQLNDSLPDLNVTGGQAENPISNLLTSDTLKLAIVSGNQVQISLGTPRVFASAPEVGDVLNIPTGSVLAGAGNVNVGWYLVQAVVNAATGSSVTAYKVQGVAPVAVASTNVSANPSGDLQSYSALNIQQISGIDRMVLQGLIGTNISASAVGNVLTVSLPAGSVFANAPQLNDYVRISSTSVLKGAGNANVGWYQVTGVTNNSVLASLTLQSLAGGAAPVSVSSVAIASISDLKCVNPQIPGVGKSLEILDGGNLSAIFLGLGLLTPASFIGSILVSAQEQADLITLKQTLGSSESYTAGGDVILTIGYQGTSASLSISATSLSTSVTGGPGANLGINLSQISTIADLITLINLQPGYYAVATNQVNSQLPPSALDEVSCNIATSIANGMPGRIKSDVYDIESISPVLASISSIATAGLPQPMPFMFLSGGAKGGTTGLQLSQAIDALQGVRTNFVVPLISQDASKDIALGLTDASSTYTVDAANAAVKAHCLAMSTAKLKRHRIGLVSKRDTFQNVQTAALNLATYRVAFLFQDVLNLNSSGAIYQFQPWMGAVIAAGMQAAGAYKSIYNKSLNISGALQAAGDYDDENLTQVEQAIQANMIPLQKTETGGYIFVTDQTTYGLDNNFVYNSLQATYVADLMAVDLATSLKNAFIGASVADVNEGVITSFIKGKMAQYLQQKYIVASPQQGAPAGWKYINVNIQNGSVAIISVGVIEASSLKFIDLTLNVEGLSSSSSVSGT